MKHEFRQKVYYADTDAYGVVWHGAYIRWLEIGRIEFCEKIGYTLVDLEAQDIVLPVVNINVQYKASAKLNDELIIETYIQKFNPLSVTFEQRIWSNAYRDKPIVEATVNVVAINNNGKLYRKMPKILVDAFKKATEKDEAYAVK